MLGPQSRVSVMDGTGVRRIRVIKALRGRGTRVRAKVGDRVRASVREAQAGSPWKKGDLVLALVVRTKSPRQTLSGRHRRFRDNACILRSDKGEPLGSRAFGPISQERRLLGQGKVLSRAQGIV